MPSVKKCETEWPADTNQVGGDFCWQPATFDHSVGVLLHSPICHLHTSYIAPYLPSKFCIAFVFHFSWVLTAVPRELKDNGYAIFFLWGGGGGGEGEKKGASWEMCKWHIDTDIRATDSQSGDRFFLKLC